LATIARKHQQDEVPPQAQYSSGPSDWNSIQSRFPFSNLSGMGGAGVGDSANDPLQLYQNNAPSRNPTRADMLPSDVSSRVYMNNYNEQNAARIYAQGSGAELSPNMSQMHQQQQQQQQQQGAVSSNRIGNYTQNMPPSDYPY